MPSLSQFVSVVTIHPLKNGVETFVSVGGDGDEMCCSIRLSSLAHLVWLCCGVSEDAARPFNLITLQEKHQMNLMKNVLLAKEVWILTDL